MSIFNAIYTLSTGAWIQPIHEDAKVSIKTDDRYTATKWMKWLVSLPVRFGHGAYNECSILYYKSINDVVARQIYSGNSIHALQFLYKKKNGHILTSKKAISALAKHYRNDPIGYFVTDVDDVFLHFLRDLCPDSDVDRDACLLTCSRDHVNSYKMPLFNYINKSQVECLLPQIDVVAEKVLEYTLTNHSDANISAQSLAETYTVAILARLFLNHPGIMEDFRKIGNAVSFGMDYRFLKKWGRPSLQQDKQYEDALTILREAIKKLQW